LLTGQLARRMMSVLAVVGSVWVLGAASASADTRVMDSDGDALATGNDCAKGCIDCQKDCHEARCMSACTMQWSGCCMTAGMKPPAQGTCACLRQ